MHLLAVERNDVLELLDPLLERRVAALAKQDVVEHVLLDDGHLRVRLAAQAREIVERALRGAHLEVGAALSPDDLRDVLAEAVVCPALRPGEDGHLAHVLRVRKAG